MIYSVMSARMKCIGNAERKTTEERVAGNCSRNITQEVRGMNGMETLHIGKPLHVYKVRFTGYYDCMGKRIRIDEIDIERESLDIYEVISDLKNKYRFFRVNIDSWKEVS